MKKILTVVCAASALFALGADFSAQKSADDGDCRGGLMPVKYLSVPRHERLQ
jgi:hypothetical protein